MSGNRFGQLFSLTTAGESHGPGLVAIIDGCPPGLLLSEADLQVELDRRKPGQSHLVTSRNEADQAEILSGVYAGETTGTPIAVLIRNQDQRSKDYGKLVDTYRPGHADFTYDQKYGRRDHRGGGRASARETAARVAGGAIARKLLARDLNTEIVGYVRQVGEHCADIRDPTQVRREAVEHQQDGSPNPVRCPDPEAAARMVALIEAMKREGNSIGGVAEVVAAPLPAGLGEPVFGRLKADLGQALFSIPAVMGVEFGSGFKAGQMTGRAHNDLFRVDAEGRIDCLTNHAGGMLGGISTGMPLVMRAAVKPTSSLPTPQDTVNRAGEPTVIKTLGRHDPCLLPRFVPIAEAMVALVLADQWLRWRAQCPDQAARMQRGRLGRARPYFRRRRSSGGFL